MFMTEEHEHLFEKLCIFYSVQGAKFNFLLSFNKRIDTLGWMWAYVLMAIGLTRILWLMSDTIDQSEKIFYQWNNTIGAQHDR